MKAPALQLCTHLAAIALTIASLPAVTFSQAPAAPTASSAAPTYAEEPVVIEHADVIISMAADGTGWKERTFVARIQSDTAVKKYGVLSIPYSSSSEHVDLRYARVRHPDGTVAETQTSDAMDMPSAVTRAAPFYSDQKELQLPIRSLRVGDTLEWKVRITITKPQAPGQFWGQQTFSDQAVELANTTELRVPPGMYVNVWSPNIKPVESTSSATAEAPTQHVYRWSYSQLNPTTGKDAEAAAAAKRKILWTADQELDLEQGKLPTIAWTTFKSWEDIGAWYRSLQTDRIVPDDVIKAKVAELTAGKSTDEAKAQALYTYVATNIRYIGVAFGIGRYQPHTAAEILSNQYGDCKDKHTLLAAMLSAAGIQSDAVLVGAGIRFNQAVPSPAAFNHLITHLTLAGKPVWLDTTAEVAPWGMLTHTTRDKQALVIPAASVAAVVRTPVDAPVPNEVKMEAVGTLDATGVSTSHIVLTTRGDGEISMRAAFRQIQPAQYDQVVQVFSKAIGFIGTTTNPETTKPADTTQPFKLSYDYKREKAGDWDHLKTIPQVMPVILTRVTDIDPPVHAIQLGIPRTEDSTSSMKLPEGWTAILPREVHAKCPYGTYDMTYRLDSNTVYAERRLVVLAKKVPVSDWKAYKDWVDKVNPGMEPYIQLVSATTSKRPGARAKQVEDALNSPDPVIENTAIAAEDTRNADVASRYVAQLTGGGDAGATRLAASRAALKANTAAAAAETAAAAVEKDASQATAASTAGDSASVTHARDKAASDYSALLDADNQLAKAAKDLVTAAEKNAVFFAANSANTAINDMAAQDSSAAENLLSAAMKDGTEGYGEAAAHQAMAIKDANTMAGLDPARANAFKAVAQAEAQAQSRAVAASPESAAAAEATAATAGATADGSANPYAGAVETSAAAVANAASATISAQHAINKLKTLN